MEIFGVFECPLLLSVESKEKSADLEANVGIKLITYIKKLMEYTPSAKRKIHPETEDWQWGDRKVNVENFKTMSAAAYLKKYAEPASVVFEKRCEILFVMNPVISKDKIGWELEIIPSTERSTILKDFMVEQYKRSGDEWFIIK